MPSSIPRISSEYVYVNNLQAFDPRSPDAAGDPTALPIAMALMPYPPGDEPSEDSWVAAEWADVSSARMLMGNGYSPGAYQVWVWIQGLIEQPRRPVGTVMVE